VTRSAAPAAVEDSALFALIGRLADNKYWLGRRYAEWCNAAPTLESAVAAAAMAQDEIGHARSHYPLLRRFVGHDVEPEDRGVFQSMSALDHPFGGWVHFVAVNFLLDTALTTLFESARDSTYDDLRTRARRICGEEQVHWLHGVGWVRRLARESSGTRAALERALAGLRDEVMMWFGPPGNKEGERLLEARIISRSPDELRSDLLLRVEPALRGAGLTPIEESDGAQSRLPWDRWDSERYRLSD